MRRILTALCALTVCSLPGNASAASWHSFKDKQLGFSLRYPSTWHLVQSDVLGTKQVVFSYQGKQLYALTVSILHIRPAKSSGATLQRFMQFEHHANNGQFNSIHWTTVTFAGRPAKAGISAPPTEGGVTIYQAVYVVGAGSQVYAISLSAYSSKPIKQLQQFPTVYRQILATWHFL